jgi:hypothetical protein
MEILAVVALVLLERLRPDLHLRRVWAGLGVPRPALPFGVLVPMALAGLDLRRLLPRLTAVLVAYVLWRTFAPPLGPDAYVGVNRLVGMIPAILGLGVLAVVAATAGRDRGQELLDALPASPRTRVWGWAVLLIGVALAEYALLAAVRFGREEPAYAALLPDAWQLAAGPLMLLGGGLLGLLVARLVSAWIAAPVAVVLGIAGVVALDREGTAMLALAVEWIQYREDDRVIVEPGSFAWHNAYLLGLCALGLVAALLREPGRRRALLAAGAVALAGTTVAGALALP